MPSGRPVGASRDQEGVKDLQKTPLQGSKERFNEGRVIEVEGIFAVVTFKEIPIE